MVTLDELMELDMLNGCAYETTKQSRWKETTQRYMSNLIPNNMELQKEVLSGKYKVSKTVDFELNERGHIRHIEAPVVRDRIVQKTLTKNVLTPSIIPYVIYDNYASIKNRGTSFARKRMEIMLRRYINKNGIDGYILLIDIKKYFENIDHEVLKRLIYPMIKNEEKRVIDLIYYILDTSSDTDKGLNLGSEAPQILALYYLTPVDNFVKIVKGVKYYGRYMDDIFIISNSKEELFNLLCGIENVLLTLKLEINKNKTHILKLSHGFTFLQIKYNILPSGRILKRLTRKKIVRERRRLKALRRLYDRGIIDEKEVWNCYQSWRGTIVKDHNACYRTIFNMDILYQDLFPLHQPVIRKGRKEACNEIYCTASKEDLNNIRKYNIKHYYGRG